MDRGNSNIACYYSLLGIRRNASPSEVRGAFRKLALKWHPDKWAGNPAVAGEAKRRFQQIQEAYSVLADKGKRAMYDAGLYDPFEEEDEEFSDFMQEMLSMMDSVGAENDSFEDLQKMFADMVGDVRPGPSDTRRKTGASDTSAGAKRSASRVNVSKFG